ncbi:MAG: hypothetical protein NC187_02015 [Candidatus Amulumruptor caecigallinarius]|nr:hypothetical protein [Candidatus Amulumruptor caecigallinarius]MCM1396252.1 hypothetical protein [Candidatus Amulumruptor caecigallinarius]MCM1454304.1 hypothetical protein [bacterium]
MKKLIFTLMLGLAGIGAANAQLTETFDNNQWGWTEQMTDLGKVYIVEGVLRFETHTRTDIEWEKIAENLSSHAYLPIDPKDGFTITFDANVDKIADDKYFGIILDYTDDMNYMIFMMRRNWAYLVRIKEGKMTNLWKNMFHLPKQKKARLDVQIQYSGGDMEFRVDDVMALKVRYAPIESNGFGFFAFGNTKVDFDNVEIKPY